MRQAVEDRIEEIKEFWRDFPETAKAFAEYAYAVETRPGMVIEEYTRCRATLAQVEEAALNTLIALNVAPAGLAAKLLRRRGRSGDTSDPESLRDELLAETENARRLPSDPDWDTIDNPGIRWGGPSRNRVDRGKIILSEWVVWENVHLTTSRRSISSTAIKALPQAQKR